MATKKDELNEDYLASIYTPKKIKQAKLYSNIAWILLLFVVTFFFIYSTTHYAKAVSGHSMYPTLNPNWDNAQNIENYDIVIVNQYSTPQKGDIIIFDATEVFGEKLLIKRVIAVAGDKLSIFYNESTNQCEVRVNDKLLNETYLISNNWKSKADAFNNGKNNTSWLVNQVDSTKVEVLNDEYGSIIIPEKHIFALGDNRNNSTDCAYFGPVKMSKCLGVVEFVSPAGTFLNTVLRNIFGIKIATVTNE